jgi:uncharacterized oligopeptide transporter (OPT) family protein
MSEETKFIPFVSPQTNMAEMTIRALVIGLIMSVVLGAANAYLGLKAGMTIAATYPAAVIGMAFLKIMKGSILEENIARTVGSIGESVAAGAIFTIPAFIIAGIWDGNNFFTLSNYLQTTAVLLVGGFFGILFITIIRRTMVEDRDLPFPESIAASEIHKAGRTGTSGAKFLFGAMGLGALIKGLTELKFFAEKWEYFLPFISKKLAVGSTTLNTGGGAILSTPGVSPAYMGVGYIIGPNLAALNFTGGLLAWGLFVPVLLFFIGNPVNEQLASQKMLKATVIEKIIETEKAADPSKTDVELSEMAASRASTILIKANKNKESLTEDEKAILDKALMPTYDKIMTAKRDAENSKSSDASVEYKAAVESSWIDAGTSIWKDIVRKIAIGGMLMSAAFTLYRMRKSLFAGLSRSIKNIGGVKVAEGDEEENRTHKDMPAKWVFIGIGIASVATFFIYNWFSNDIGASLVATIVMVIAGFFFAAVSGYLVGLIGSSNNPISGLTISALLIAALLMVVLGMKGVQGIAAVLGVAAVVCVAAAVAGEMLQDLKVGHILGGTPWKMQTGDMLGIVISAAVMFFPLFMLHQGDINKFGGVYIPGITGLGGEHFSAPQASLMAILSKGIVGGDMAWPLIIVGILMAIGFILVKVKSPMLVCVGMYLPLETSFAIFIGGLIKGILDRVSEKRQFNGAQVARSSNNGVLLAAGLIAGEALIGLLFAFFAVIDVKVFAIFDNPSFLVSSLVYVVVAMVLVIIPLRNAGKPDDPAIPMQM